MPGPVTIAGLGQLVSHGLLLGKVHGTFSEFEGRIARTTDPASRSIAVTIRAASISTDNPQRDSAPALADFLDPEVGRDLTFASTASGTAATAT